MARLEFPRAIRVEIVRRATIQINGKGVVRCEECGLVGPKAWHVDHTIPDALFLDKKRKLTAADGKVLCAGSPETCHGRKTPEDVRTIAKAKRNEAATLRVSTAPSRPIQSAGFAKSAKAAARAANGHREPLPRILPPGFEPASSSRARVPHHNPGERT